MKKNLIYFSLLIYLIGCQPVVLTQPAPRPTTDAGFTVPTLPTQEPEKDSTQMTQPAQPSPSSGLEFLIEKAKEDLAQRLSISLSQIDLVEATEVVWPNASLGCPQPGMAYAEVLTPGYLILLNADNKEYQYHTSRSTEVIYCENPTPPIPGTPGDI